MVEYLNPALITLLPQSFPYQSIKTLAKSRSFTCLTFLQHLILFTILSTIYFLLLVSLLSHLCVDSQIWVRNASHSPGLHMHTLACLPGLCLDVPEILGFSVSKTDWWSDLSLPPPCAPFHYLCGCPGQKPSRTTLLCPSFLPTPVPVKDSHFLFLVATFITWIHTSPPLSSNIRYSLPASRLLSPVYWACSRKIVFLKCRADHVFP